MGSTSKQVADRLLERVPAESRPLIAELLAEPLRSPAALREEATAHLEHYLLARRTNEFLDPDLATELAERCRRLVEHLDAHATEDEQRLVQIAVRYFAIIDDGDADLSIAGLEDDALVLDAVEELLDLPPGDPTAR